MIILHPFGPLPSCFTITSSKPLSHNNIFLPPSTVLHLVPRYTRTWTSSCSAKSRREDLNGKDFDLDTIKKDMELEDDENGGFPAQGMFARREAMDIGIEKAEEDKDDDGGYSGRGPYAGPYAGRQEKDYDIGPEFAEILGSVLDDPQKSRSKIEERRRKKEKHARREAKDIDIEVQEDEDDGGGYSGRGVYAGREERDYDRDPELAEILGSAVEDPQKAQSRIEERIRNKRNEIIHTKTGSGIPMKVSFNKFDFSNSYIWLEFYNAPLAKDISLICDTIRSWHIIGRLGGCNAMNMQLSQSPIDKRPSYDYIQGANVTPTTFYNIGDLEVQDNFARIWVDIGTYESLLLDVLVNALTQISSDFVGIKQVVFGGGEFENWNENLTSEDSGFNVHKI